MASKAILTCRPNSHPFQDRILILDQAVKIGRSVARARSAPNNAIFDCKVLSRNHALFWYSNGKFYLQDTKSSNGTFVNNQRLSKSGEESVPREVCSGDIVQFGVDVLENARKVTHGCIVANVKLFLPDGKEAKSSASSSSIQAPGSYYDEDLYQLNQFVQEAVQREQMLEDKLSTLQTALENIWQAADQGWKALITEDKLLSRVENLENQIQTYSKDFTEDKLRDELRKLQEDKEQYQNAAKDSLHKVLEEKIESDKQYQEVKRSLVNVEAEYNNLRTQMIKSHSDIQELAQKFSAQIAKNELLQLKYQELDDKYRDSTELLKAKTEQLEMLEKHFLSKIDEKSPDKILKETIPGINILNAKDTNALGKDKDLVAVKDETKYQPHLSDEVQLKLVSQLQEITDKYTLNEEDIENSKFVEEGLDDFGSDKTAADSDDEDKEKEVLKIQLEEAQLVAEQNKLISSELMDQIKSLTAELELKTAMCDNRLKDELNSTKQECLHLQEIIKNLESDISRYKCEETTTNADENPIINTSESEQLVELKNKILLLQEELVTVETMYMHCHDERTLLNKQFKKLQSDQHAFKRPLSFFFIVLPYFVVLLAFIMVFCSSVFPFS